MASICKDPGGSHRICFMAADGQRRTIWLGVCSLTAARQVANRVEQLVSNQKLGVRHDTNLTQWLRSCPPPLKSKLRKAGLVEESAEPLTITQLFERRLASSLIADASAAVQRRIAASLVEYFGSAMQIDRIRAAEAERWQASLRDAKCARGRPLARSTIGKYTSTARGTFNRAVRWGLIDSNPFAGLKSDSQVNAARQHYVPTTVFRSVLATEQDAKWQAVFSLLRFGGLRCPSEVRALRWSDVDLAPDKLQLTVRSIKTERYAGREQRIVPIVPELRPILDRYAKSVQSKEGLLFPDLPSAVNVRQRFQRMLAKAGVKAWPKLFQNLRASFATDMVERFPTHTVASWCGHSVTIQQKAYMIARDSHFKAATAGGSILGSPSRDSASDIASTAQNSAPHGIASVGADSQSHP